MTKQLIPFRALICSALTLLVAACSTSSDGGGPSGPQTAVASVEVTPSPASVPVGGTLQLTATLKDAAGAVLTGREITWSSSAVPIATVSTTGLVTGVAQGASVQIAATSEGISGTASVTVQVPVASVQVAPAAASVAVGGTVQLSATLRDAGGNILVGRTVAWTSSDVAIASASPTGLVTGVAQGAATITATSEGKTGTASMTVVVTSFASLSAGRFHTCGITTDGDAHCWGSAEDGQLGDGQSGAGVLSPQPVAVSGALAFDVISAGAAHTCGVITGGGSAFCWGLNADGQLGNGTGTDAATPALVIGGFSFASGSAGSDHSCGLTTTGGAFCFGLNNFGQLGDGTTNDRLAPVAVGGGLTFTSLSAGDEHTCALDDTGSAHCWGRGDRGQLGDGTAADSDVPVAVFGTLTFVSISAGADHTCGLTSTGEGYCWGLGTEGQLGRGTNASSNLPLIVSGTYTSLTVGSDHTCAVTSTGAAHCWGRNDFGQIGNGMSGVGLTLNTPTLVAGGLTFASLDGGDEHTCGVTGTGDAYCWGSGTFGRLGNGGFADQNTPSKVVSPL